MGSNTAFRRFTARLVEYMEVSITNGDGIANRLECSAEAKDDRFGVMARELFELQFEYNEAYRMLCQARGCTPASLKHWSNIPAAPTAAFKELELSCLRPDERTTFFLSSGTTEQKRSRHWHSSDSLGIYEKSLLGWFKAHFSSSDFSSPLFGTPPLRGRPELPAKSLRILALTPPRAAAPNSSLVHMFDSLARSYGTLDSRFAGRVASDGSWDVDLISAANSFRQAVEREEPVIVLGTAFSFVHLIDELRERFVLPAGSCAFETGGYKGRSRVLPKDDLHRLISASLGISPNHIVCEYGMAELSSQAYDRALVDSCPKTDRASVCYPRNFTFPPWARVQIISAETGRPTSEGEAGLIRVFDLANVYSVMAVQTEDIAIRHGDGFELLGRAEHVEPRGCSIMALAS